MTDSHKNTVDFIIDLFNRKQGKQVAALFEVLRLSLVAHYTLVAKLKIAVDDQGQPPPPDLAAFIKEILPPQGFIDILTRHDYTEADPQSLPTVTGLRKRLIELRQSQPQPVQ